MSGIVRPSSNGYRKTVSARERIAVRGVINRRRAAIPESRYAAEF